MSHKKKELKREYQQSHRPMGVYQIRNLVNDKILVGATLNLPGIFNRHQFQLKAGSHPNKLLQAEWQAFGSHSFVFEILDELTPGNDPAQDYRTDLEFLEALWLEKLQPFGDASGNGGYNEKKKGRAEKLRLIAQNRSGEREAEEIEES